MVIHTSKIVYICKESQIVSPACGSNLIRLLPYFVIPSSSVTFMTKVPRLI